MTVLTLAEEIQATRRAMHEAAANLQQAKEHADLFPSAANISVVAQQADHVEQLRAKYNALLIADGADE